MSIKTQSIHQHLLVLKRHHILWRTLHKLSFSKHTFKFRAHAPFWFVVVSSYVQLRWNGSKHPTQRVTLHTAQPHVDLFLCPFEAQWTHLLISTFTGKCDFPFTTWIASWERLRFLVQCAPINFSINSSLNCFWVIFLWFGFKFLKINALATAVSNRKNAR